MINEKRYQHVINFIENLKLTEGQFAGKPFELMHWQKDYIYNAYGTLKNNNKRKFEYLYLEVGKKNGKSGMASGLALYHLYADGEINGEVYSAASDRQQASITFDSAVSMIEAVPALKKRTRLVISKKEIHNKITGTFYKAISSEAYSKHGLKVSCCILDELHSFPNRDLWDVLTYGAGDSREQPIWIIITTAGDDPDKNSIGWEIHSKAKKIINGELIDNRWYAKIYAAEENDDIWEEKTWFKANPSLGHTIDIEKVRAAAESAKYNEAEEKLFKWLRCNMWVSLKDIGWVPLTLWDSTTKEIPDLTGLKCYGGLDLSSTTDLTALTLTFPPQEELEFWYQIFVCWVPLEKLKEKSKAGIPYDKWVREKQLEATPGNAVDYEYIEATIEQMSIKYNIACIGVDPWNSRTLTQRLMKKEIKIIEVPQTFGGMSPGMKWYEKLLRDKKLYHENNPVARWCFGNVVIVVDGNENIKPMKNKSKDKIDITVSSINSMAVAMFANENKGAYEEHGIISL